MNNLQQITQILNNSDIKFSITNIVKKPLGLHFVTKKISDKCYSRTLYYNDEILTTDLYNKLIKKTSK